MGSRIVLRLDRGKGNPRNSEGAFVTLADGRLMYAYTRFYGRNENDYGKATIVARYSADGGRTWSTDDRRLVPNEGRMNVMSVSLLRLQDGRISLFYLCKNSIRDCLPYMRLSDDEGETWGAPVLCVHSPGYFVVNNDRVVQLRSGRLIIPAAFHRTCSFDGTPQGEQHDPRALTMFFYSDDGGCTWHESDDWWSLPMRTNSGLQEPGVVELKRGRLYGWARTDAGYQWEMRSRNRGDTWTTPQRSRFKSPCSPLSIKRIPATGHLLAVWNDHSSRWNLPKAGKDGVPVRTPLVLATSADEGRTWRNAKLIETARNRGFCYTAIHSIDDAVLLAYSCGLGTNWGLPDSCIRRITLDWIYA